MRLGPRPISPVRHYDSSVDHLPRRTEKQQAADLVTDKQQAANSKRETRDQMARKNNASRTPTPEIESAEDQQHRENLPAVKTLQPLAPVNERNAFESYGQQMSQKTIVGTLLKFNKGDWLAGQDDEEIEPGTKLAVNMDQLMVGWIKWVDNRPEQQIMGPIAEGYQPPRRDTLGDLDKEAWELDNDDKPRDPWQFSNYVVMKTPGKKAVEDELYTFAGSSKGALTAIGELCKSYGKEMRVRPDEYPIVELGVGKYKHSNAQYGIIKFPILTVVGWEKKDLFAQVATESEEEEPPRQVASGGKKRR